MMAAVFMSLYLYIANMDFYIDFSTIHKLYDTAYAPVRCAHPLSAIFTPYIKYYSPYNICSFCAVKKKRSIWNFYKKEISIFSAVL